MRSMPGRFVLTAVSLMCVLMLAACNCAPTLRYISVAPTTMTIDAGTTQQFTATIYYSDGTHTDATATAAWSSSAPAVATVNASGVATGLTNGTTIITATFGGLSASATLTVARTLQSITVAPVTATVAVGLTQPFTASGTYLLAGGGTSTVDITPIASWNSSNTAVATIDSTQDATNGTATGVTPGTTSITASLDGITSTNTATLTVGGAVVTAIQVTPATVSIAVGNTVTLTAMELFSDGTTTQAPTAAVTWTAGTCAPTGSVTIASNGSTNNETEIVSGQAVTTAACTITATEGTLTPGTSAVSVIPGTATNAYLANGNDSTIGQYGVTASSSTPLAPLTPATVTATSPQQVILHPNGLYAYSIDASGGSRIHIYDVAPAGATAPGTLTLRTGDPNVAGGTGPTNVSTIDPTGRYLYVIDYNGNDINGFSINQTDGTLTAIGAVTGYTDASIPVPSQALIDRTGKFMYVINFTDPGTVSVFTINSSTGALTPVGTPTTVGHFPVFGTIGSANPGAQILVVPGGDNSISAFTIDPTAGTLTSAGSATTVTGAMAFENAVVDPTGKYLYVVDYGDGTTIAGQIYSFNISAAGVIGAEIGTPLPTGIAPGYIVIDPSGVLIAIDNNGATTNGTISLYSVAAGALTADIPVAAGGAPFGVTFYIANQ